MKRRWPEIVVYGLLICCFVAGCGGPEQGKSTTGRTALETMTAAQGEPVLYGGQEGRLLRLNGPERTPYINKREAGLVWQDEGFYAVAAGQGLVHFTIQDQAILVDAVAGQVKGAGTVEGSDGSRLFYKQKSDYQPYVREKRDTVSPVWDRHQGYFMGAYYVTPVLNKNQGFIWNSSGQIYTASLDRGQVADVEEGQFPKQGLYFLSWAYADDRSFFVQGLAQSGGQIHTVLHEYALDGRLIHMYHLGSGDAGDGQAPLVEVTARAVTKDYVIIYDGRKKELQVYDRKQGSFMGIVQPGEGGTLPGEISILAPIRGNLLLLYDNNGGEPCFYLLQLANA